jgi:RNA polymerase sigma-70 factor (sigma-E family)
MAATESFEGSYVARDAFSAAVAAHHHRLAGFAYLLCGDRITAEDLVAEAYARVWPKFRNQQVDDLGPYLRTAVANLATGRLRRLRLERRETERRDLDWRLGDGRPARGFESTIDDRDLLWQAIWALPVDQRAVIVLRLVEDLSEQSCAKVLGIRPGTVKSRLARGLATLRTSLEGDI